MAILAVSLFVTDDPIASLHAASATQNDAFNQRRHHILRQLNVPHLPLDSSGQFFLSITLVFMRAILWSIIFNKILNRDQMYRSYEGNVDIFSLKIARTRRSSLFATSIIIIRK